MRDRWPGLLAGMLASVMLIAAGGCKKPQAAAAPPPPAVTVARPIEREVIEWDEYTGRLEPTEMVEVRARVSGFIDKADFEEGAMVKAGQLLFVIDSRPFEAELAQARAEVQRAQAQRDYAANDFKRLEGLRPTGGASELEVENARQKMLEAEASIAAAKAQEQIAALDVEWTKVTAPISGRISRKIVTPGNLINGGGGASASGNATLLTTIASLDPIYAYMDVDEQSVLKYQRLSQEKKRISARDMQIPIFMGLSSEEGFPHEGVVDFVDNRIDPDTGTLRGRGVFANPFPHYLTPGLFARLRIPGSGRYVALLIPDLAIGTDQDQRFLLVVKDDGTVERRAVRLGAQFGRFRAIEEGVTADDRVIINGLQRARPGEKVTAQEAPLNADEVPLTAPGSAATQSLPTTRRLPATRSVPTTAPTNAPTTDPARIGAAL
ncbi:MAG: efflux RND transporter periplasmic adaptor subunit [Tepidisphaeraceae bacterium]